MSGLFSMVEAFLVILAFCLGVMFDSHIRSVSVAVSATETTNIQLTDEEKIQITEQQKALEQCMNYSPEIAYGGQNATSQSPV